MTTEPVQPVKIHAAYVVALNDDGSLSTISVKPGNPVFFDVDRETTTYDIFSSSKEIANEIESQLMADRISKAVISNLTPKNSDVEAKARIAEALAERKSE